MRLVFLRIMCMIQIKLRARRWIYPALRGGEFAPRPSASADWIATLAIGAAMRRCSNWIESRAGWDDGGGWQLHLLQLGLELSLDGMVIHMYAMERAMNGEAICMQSFAQMVNALS